jgi:hypothetical protein
MMKSRRGLTDTFARDSVMLAEKTAYSRVAGVSTEAEPMVSNREEPCYPTSDEQFYRIVGSTAGGVIFGSAVGVAIGFGALASAIVGGIFGLGVSAGSAAAVRAIKE